MRMMWSKTNIFPIVVCGWSSSFIYLSLLISVKIHSKLQVEDPIHLYTVGRVGSSSIQYPVENKHVSSDNPSLSSSFSRYIKVFTIISLFTIILLRCKYKKCSQDSLFQFSVKVYEIQNFNYHFQNTGR